MLQGVYFFGWICYIINVSEKLTTPQEVLNPEEGNLPKEVGLGDEPKSGVK